MFKNNKIREGIMNHRDRLFIATPFTDGNVTQRHQQKAA